jgi:hypothetical protein
MIRLSRLCKKAHPSFRTFFMLALLAIADPALTQSGFIGRAAADDADDVFVIEGVRVDITADNAVAAREQAFNQAQQDAFEQLAESLLSDKQLNSFQPPDVPTISSFVRDYEITDEQLSSVRYIGTYTFRFDKRAVRNYISRGGFTFTDVSSKPVLMLPFYKDGRTEILWGDENPWLAAWNAKGSVSNLVPVRAPIGDAADMADVGDDQSMTYIPSNLRRMMGRYHAGSVVVAVAQPQWKSGAQPAADAQPDKLQIKVYTTTGAPELVSTIDVAADDLRGSKDTLYAAGVRRVREGLQHDWKTRTLVDSSEVNRINVSVSFRSMQEWIETQKALNHVQGVNDVRMISLTPTLANVELIFSGSEDRLRLALAQSDMTLTSPSVQFASGQSPLVYQLYLNKYHD